MAVLSDPLIERRQSPPELSSWWAQLSLAQKFSASSLGKFGYELMFVRSNDGLSLAVLQSGGTIAVVNEDGEIDTSPDIHIR